MLTRFATLGDVGIEAVSAYLPAHVVSTAELFAGAPSEVENLVRLTGIQRRHVASAAEATSDLAAAAARGVIAGRPVSRVLLATVSPDYPSPATAPLVQHMLGLPPCPALDLSAACAGFVYAVDAAARAVLTGDERVLVLAAELKSRSIADAPPGVRCLFGDGACAATVVREGRLRLEATFLHADGAGHSLVRVPAGGTRMPTTAGTLREGLHAVKVEDGAHVFFAAVEGLVEVAEKLLAGVGLKTSDVTWFVPHQANGRILERVGKLLRIPEGQMVSIVEDTANVGGASAGIALASLVERGVLRAGQRILVLTAGAGLSAGAALFSVRDGS